ncbi:MAG: hypothetical protein K9L02_02140 [Acholeplasmataceae bacterium]|nr:hypothetical protein [Acholeplasmataceae bacterium]
MFSALKRRIYLSLTLVVLLFGVSLVAVFAYFQTQEQRGIIIQTGDFEVEVFASFSGVVVDYNSPYYNRETGTLIVNAYDSLSSNYVGNLEISVEITAVVPARMRMKLQEQWTLTRTYLDQDPLYPIADVIEVVYNSNHGAGYYPFSLLKIPPTFTPIYDVDGYAYMSSIIPKGVTTTFDFIQSGDPYIVKNNEVFTETCFLYIDLMIDVVQANRFSEIWGIDPNFYN